MNVKKLLEAWCAAWPELAAYGRLTADYVDAEKRALRQAAKSHKFGEHMLDLGLSAKVKNEPAKAPTKLGEWYALHNKHGRPWLEGKIGEWQIHKCGACGDKVYVASSQHHLGMDAAIDPPK